MKDFIEGETFSVESVETGKKQIVVIEARDRKFSPHLEIVDKKGEIVAGSTIFPVKATLVVNDKEEVERGQTFLLKYLKKLVNLEILLVVFLELQSYLNLENLLILLL